VGEYTAWAEAVSEQAATARRGNRTVVDLDTLEGPE
jgi:hypothetical protein